MGLCRDLDNEYEIARSTRGERLWSCDGPGCDNRRVPWSKKWRWYGSIKEWENDHFSVFSLCCDQCQEAFEATMNPDKPEPRN